MIFVDSTVPIYLVGAEHRHKTDAQVLLERAITAHDRLVTDVAALHEILRRYTAIDHREAIEPALDAILGVVDDVISIEEEDVVRAKEMVYGPERLSARTCLHLAIMERHGIRRMMSFDPEYDRYSEVSRLSTG
jgi:predicted nucleic acid-binding protein